MVDRDELAARCLVALLGNAERGGGDDGSYAVDAVSLADALLARLASSAPVAPAPAAAPVDREGLADAIRRANAHGASMTPWPRLDVYDRTRFLNCADAAIAFLRGGAS